MPIKNVFLSLWRFSLATFFSIILFIFFFGILDSIEHASIVLILKKISILALQIGATIFWLFVSLKFWNKNKVYFYGMLFASLISILFVMMAKFFSETNRMYGDYSATYSDSLTIERVIDCNTIKFTGDFEGTDLIGVQCQGDEKIMHEAEGTLRDLLDPYIKSMKKVLIESNPKEYGYDQVWVYLPYCLWDWKGVCKSNIGNSKYVKSKDGLYFSLNETMINKYNGMLK